MLEDTMEMNEDDEEIEEEADAEVEQVLFELTNGKLGIAGSVSTELPVSSMPRNMLMDYLTVIKGAESEVSNAEAERKMEEYRAQLDGLLSN